MKIQFHAEDRDRYVGVGGRMAGELVLSRRQTALIITAWAALILASAAIVYQTCFAPPTMLVPSPDMLPKTTVQPGRACAERVDLVRDGDLLIAMKARRCRAPEGYRGPSESGERLPTSESP